MKKTVLVTRRGATAIAVLLAATLVNAQTRITPPDNNYTPAQDVELGLKAAEDVRRQLPVLHDDAVSSYIEDIGHRLVAAIPSDLRHPEFRYTFEAVNVREINAFALPGGPMFVNRGMIEAAHTEGEVAGVMAHELSHVALRHGTAQATKAQKYQTGAAVAGILGTIFGGPGLGQVAQVPFALTFLRYSREYETEADLLGARIMANAGYDPRDLANMFRTIEAQGGGGGGFLSDHPSPANRYARINQEAQYLRINNLARNNQEFMAIKERLRGYPRAQTMAEIQQSGRRYPNQGSDYPNDRNNYPNGDRTNYPSAPRGRVEYPSSRFRTYTALGVARLSVPDNWREMSEQESVWYAPSGGYGSANGQAVFTHGINIGVAQSNSSNLQQATNDFLNALQQNSGNLRARGGYQRTYVGNRNGLLISLSNTNEATGEPEVVNVVTTQLRNGELLYIISVAPESDYNTYLSTFQNILRSVQLND